MNAISHLALAAVIAIGMHEAGHVVAAVALRARIVGFGFNWRRGPWIARQFVGGWRGALISMAGPLVNLTLAFIFIAIHPWFAGFLLNAGLFINCGLIPTRDSDVRHAWQAISAKG